MTFYLEMPIDELQQVAENNPSELTPQLALISRLSANAEVDSALELTDKMLRTFPENAGLLAAKSTCHAVLGNVGEAYRLIQLALRRVPSIEMLDQIMGETAASLNGAIHDNMCSPSLVIEEIEQHQAEANLDSEFLAKLRSSAEIAEFFEEEPDDMALAEEKLKRHVEQFPEDLNIKLELALLYDVIDEPKKSERCYLEVIAADPRCVPAYFELASVVSEAERAVEFAQKGLELFPDYEAGRLNLGAYLLRVGRFDEARRELSRVPTDSPYYLMSLWNSGTTYLEEADWREAIKIQEKIVALSPADVDSWNRLGYLCLEAEDLEESLAHFDEALKLDAENIEALNNRAVALGDLNRDEEAISVLEYALRISPDDVYLLTTLALRQSAIGDHEAAIETSQKALELHPENARLWLNLGSFYYRQRAFEDCVLCSRKALELDPQKGRAYWNIASVHAVQSEKEACLANLEKAVELSPEMAHQLTGDEDFKPFLDDPRFVALAKC